MGRSHLMLGGAGFLAAGVPLLALCGRSLSVEEMAAGTIVCAGAAMLPDLDHPAATCARSLGPVTAVLSRIVNKAFGGHRQGTHSLLFIALAGFLSALLLNISSGPWVALFICFFFSSLVVRTLTETRGIISAALSVLVAATLITIAPNQEWIFLSIVLGCLLHDVGDVITPEGVPPLWPISKMRVSVPVVGHTGDWREGLIAGVCGIALCVLLATQIFLPTWDTNTAKAKSSSAPAKSSSAPAKSSSAPSWFVK